MTIDDLVDVFCEHSGKAKTEDELRAGIRAVVTAFRDEVQFVADNNLSLEALFDGLLEPREGDKP